MYTGDPGHTWLADAWISRLTGWVGWVGLVGLANLWLFLLFVLFLFVWLAWPNLGWLGWLPSEWVAEVDWLHRFAGRQHDRPSGCLAVWLSVGTGMMGT